MDLSIVIPAYNEEGNIKSGALRAVNEYLTNKKYSWEVLIVDDASTDGTVKLVEAFVKKHSGFKYVKERYTNFQKGRLTESEKKKIDKTRSRGPYNQRTST